jgi:hypothetical protein
MKRNDHAALTLIAIALALAPAACEKDDPVASGTPMTPTPMTAASCAADEGLTAVATAASCGPSDGDYMPR